MITVILTVVNSTPCLVSLFLTSHNSFITDYISQVTDNKARGAVHTVTDHSLHTQTPTCDDKVPLYDQAAGNEKKQVNPVEGGKITFV